MNSKGIHLSLEAMFSMVVLACIIVAAGNSGSGSAGQESLYTLQKQHDLFRVWALGGVYDMGEMERDVEFVFPNNAFELNVDGVVAGRGKPREGTSGSTVRSECQTAAGVVAVGLTVYYRD